MDYRHVLMTFALAVACFAGSNEMSQAGGGPFGATYLESKPLPNGGRPRHKVPFPQIADWQSLRMTLKRSICYGTCPEYSIEIAGDGTVRYDGSSYVGITGEHTANIPQDAVHKLYNAFVKADFFWSFDEYRAHAFDVPHYIVTISFDGRSKSVLDFVGEQVGMPQALMDLEDMIDRTADTARWVRGTDPLAVLAAEKWNFRSASEANLALIAAAADRGDILTVKRLLAAGVSARSKFGCKGVEAAAKAGKADLARTLLDAGAPVGWGTGPDDYDYCNAVSAGIEGGNAAMMKNLLTGDGRARSLFGCKALEAAAASRNAELVDMLLDAGAPVRWDSMPTRYDRCGALVAGAGSSVVRIVRAMLRHHPDVDAHDESGRTALMSAVGGQPVADGIHDPAAITNMLINAGADVNLRDGSGRSAIMQPLSSARVVRALLMAGARDFNRQNASGETALMLSTDPEVLEALLARGADPWLVDSTGRNALERLRDPSGKDAQAAVVLKRWMTAYPNPH